MAKSKKSTLPTKMEFVGAQMSNLLYAMTNDTGVPANLRVRADQLRQKWDTVSKLSYRVNNPIVMAELEKRLFRS